MTDEGLAFHPDIEVENISPSAQQQGVKKSKKVTKSQHAFKRTGTPEIMAMQFPPINWIVPGYMAEGLVVLAGRQKLGKTWLAMDWAIAVACGGFAMGAIDCEVGDVLYVDLENGQRRIQRRIDTIFPNAKTRPDLSRLEWVTEAPAINAGFIGGIESWRRSVAKPKLVVIDVLQRIKPPGSPGRNAYENDYSTFSELQTWATESGIGVLALHHTRKGGADDPLEALSGSNGLPAVADTTLVLDRDGNGITLYVRGRDIEEKETALRFDAGIWTLIGEAADVRRSNERVTILVTLEQASEPMSPSELAAVTSMKNGNVRKLLHVMLTAGEVQKTGRGKYIHPDHASKYADPETPGNNGNAVTSDAAGEPD